MFVVRRYLLTGLKKYGVQRTSSSRNIATMLSHSSDTCNMLYQNRYSVPILNSMLQRQFSSSSNNKDNKNVDRTADVQANLTRAQKLKKAVAEYGTTVIVFHVSISLISLGSCYVLVSTGLDVNQLLINVGLSEWAKENIALVSNASTFAVAYAIHKLFAPVRISITLASVPFIVRYLRLKGFLKK